MGRAVLVWDLPVACLGRRARRKRGAAVPRVACPGLARRGADCGRHIDGGRDNQTDRVSGAEVEGQMVSTAGGFGCRDTG